ncbi:hypothetical protein EJC51_47450 [Streptomyces aquilus]|uniref:Uncharacterized protein n=1 Tax=Streptomyces aquilus TaxID=2548456 RepID=A0A3S9HRH8_9ACTN|nr:hypothetical protein [Streptomyces aquilus]AZP14716.1 hypothetical protein EJC51_00095 [Streptomyces aquilus]AZP22988.1 hypothetical protein EJC51_47450 [Streptomyces aquilus]
MTDQHQTPSPDPGGEAPDRPLTLAVVRHLVREDWKGLPGDTLVVLSRDAEGNLFSPFASYSHSRYAPTHSELVGDVYPLPEELTADPSLRELYGDSIPDTALPALVLYPLG